MENLDRELDGGTNEAEPLEVLLQLTLPIVLILALLVVTEVEALQKQMKSIISDVQGTEPGELRSELEITVLELQHQLLLKATDEIAAEEREDIGLRAYGLRRPSAGDVHRGRIHEEFQKTSVLLAERFNGRNRPRTEDRLAREIRKRFKVLALDVLARRGAVKPERQRNLLHPTSENLSHMQTHLDGHLLAIEEVGVAVQEGLVREWLLSEESEELKKRSKGLWVKVQGGDAAFAMAFENLRVDLLFESLADQGVAVLDTLRVKVLESGEVEL